MFSRFYVEIISDHPNDQPKRINLLWVDLTSSKKMPKHKCCASGCSNLTNLTVGACDTMIAQHLVIAGDSMFG